MAKVIIYTTPTCGYCKQAKAYFQEHDIEYTEKDVAADLEAQKEMMTKSGQLGTPVIDIDGEAIIGFNKPKIDMALGLS